MEKPGGHLSPTLNGAGRGRPLGQARELGAGRTDAVRGPGGGGRGGLGWRPIFLRAQSPAGFALSAPRIHFPVGSVIFSPCGGRM